ncbi:MarR family winged helix-turn-helix transcriptional regulator [Kutzneria sp. CA-103260]|uniref:MarR family winged helix-turn-helix transcriptional regulator n=1 Tax=Kutzneria sp. CA-103260 TaxID=2802641 RepID=UPI001BA49BF4|nr:MarR family winged helix-turn-helix transcriptional regulator [Kutzneria sp. CA-103260]QUQ65581.1 MarR family transcriptional regulator [Kutzneria sp. CA-103260]
MSDDHVAGREINLALRRILQAGREMQAALARRLGVRVTDVQAVDHVVSSADPLGPVELGTRLGIRSASATVLVDRLVAAGHLTRTPDPRDGRRIALQATDHARKEVRAALTPLVDRVEEIAGQLDDDQVRTVLGFLDSVIEAMHDYAVDERSERPSE